MSKQANKQSIDLVANAMEAGKLYADGFGTLEQLKADFVVAMKALSPTWHKVPTVGSGSKKFGNLSLLDQQINQIREAMAIKENARLISKGKTVAEAGKRESRLWNDAKTLYKQQIGEVPAKAEAGKAGKAEAGKAKAEDSRTTSQIVRDTLEQVAALIAATSNGNLGRDPYLESVAPKIRELIKLAGQFKVLPSPTK